jgi:hypothetical protein
MAEYTKELVQILTEYESELYAIESVLRINTGRDIETKLGKLTYSFTLYKRPLHIETYNEFKRACNAVEVYGPNVNA